MICNGSANSVTLLKMFGILSSKFLARELNNTNCTALIKRVKADTAATFRTSPWSRTNNHLANIRFTASAEEVESFNEKYSFWINLPCRAVLLVKKKIKDGNENCEF